MRLFLCLLACLILAPSVARAQLVPPAAPAPRAAASGPAARTTPARQPQVVPTPPTQPGGRVGGPGGERAGVVPRQGRDAAEGMRLGTVASPPVPSAYARQTVRVARCARPPRIDGTLDDPCWRTATHAAGFYPLNTSVPIAPADQTEVWVCADSAHLYIAYRCLDSHPNLIRASETVRDGNVYADDLVGVDIDSQNTRHGYSTFLVTPRGTQAETLEGGTADNITWAGDWKAVTARRADGWTCEMSIPFALLRYSKGARAFGMDFFRTIARSAATQNWPYLPPAGASAEGEQSYIHEFTGLAPTFYPPRPVFLPYVLSTAGAGSSAREGLDIKYPLTTTVTGVATLFPDFQTIEQDVVDVSFSYTEKLLTDRRPFFAEGRDFLPYQDVFYSRRISAVDGGVKVVGKQGDTTLGFLGTGARGVGGQSAGVLSVSQSFGLYSNATLNLVDDTQPGSPSNQVAKLEGVYGWASGPTRFYVQGDHIPSWQSGKSAGAKDYFKFYTRPTDGHPSLRVDYTDISPLFISTLGYVPEVDLRGPSLAIKQSNHFAAGPVEQYQVGLYGTAYQHHAGGFFRNDVNPYAEASDRRGYSINIGYDLSRRSDVDSNNLPVQYHDRIASAGLGWGGKTLYQQGSLSESFGRQAGQRYNYLSLAQGILVARPFNVQINVNRQMLGSAQTTQSIFTGTYRLSAVRTVGGRIVTQSGSTDVYFSFGQQVRAGTDVFLLFGDPNSARTRGKLTLKIVRPF